HASGLTTGDADLLERNANDLPRRRDDHQLLGQVLDDSHPNDLADLRNRRLIDGVDALDVAALYGVVAHRCQLAEAVLGDDKHMTVGIDDVEAGNLVALEKPGGTHSHGVPANRTPS